MINNIIPCKKVILMYDGDSEVTLEVKDRFKNYIGADSLMITHLSVYINEKMVMYRDEHNEVVFQTADNLKFYPLSTHEEVMTTGNVLHFPIK